MSSIERRNEEIARRISRRRSIAIALTLGAMVVMFYAATIVRLGSHAMPAAM